MRGWFFVILAFWSTAAAAQTDDRGYLTALLEDNLSGAGRQVTISGFAGALSSQATIESLTIADAEGIWLTLNGVALDWNRSALLRGEVSVNALTAKEIILARAPAVDKTGLPSPEATGFSLPELPVSVDIGRVAAERIEIGPSLLGTRIEGTFEASLLLSEGDGQASLSLDRIDDGPDGKVALTASYSNASRQLALDLDASEAEGGIAATVLGLPGKPAIALTVKGNGPIESFSADVGLVSDGTDRMRGTVTIGGSEEGALKFSADIGGDLAPLFLPEYADFFGSEVALLAKGQRSKTGQISLSDLSLRTRALAVTGALALASDGLPESFALKLAVGAPDGTPVLLPLSGDQETRISRASLDLNFNAATDKGWVLQGTVDGVERPDIEIGRLSLDGSGRIGRTPKGKLFGFNLSYAAMGLAPTNPAVARAIGNVVAGSANGYWHEGSGILNLSKFTLEGDGITAAANGTIDGLSNGFAVAGQAEADIADLSRLSGLVGRSMAGQGAVKIGGTANLLGGSFDLTGDIGGVDVSLGQPELDGLLAGASSARISVLRNQDGTVLRQFDLAATTLRATASGKIATAGSDIAADLDFADLSVLGGAYRGALAAKATFTGTLQSGEIVFDGQGNGLAVGQPEADKLLRGTSGLSVVLGLKDGALGLGSAKLSNAQLTAEATAPAGPGSRIDLSARLANLGLLLPEFPGAVALTGTALPQGQAYLVNLKALGPGQINATIKGSVIPGGPADLAMSGTAQAALANALLEPRAVSGPVGFDLALKGPIQLSSLSGRLNLSGGRITSPELPFALQEAAVSATLSGGRAQLTGQANVSTGGSTTLSGNVGLAAPYVADLSIRLRGVVLRDPQLYQTTAVGNLSVSGSLMGGALVSGNIRLGDTELQIPSSGLSGIEAIPELRHVREPEPVRATRQRAGLEGGAGSQTKGGGSKPVTLDLAISAPNRVFLRGRGLDAELGGSLRLGGTTANVIPEGGLNLIRGRLDILGKRLILTDAQLRMEGDLVPFIRIAASTSSDGITSSVLIEGRADDPIVSFASSPPLPQEEVLSRLLFGRGLETLSAFQAAQLASAVASLAGKGGEGIVAKLRKGFGLDDLDVRTAEDGTASLRAGKYISRNTYTEIEVDQQGKSQIQLNLDVTDSVTVRGRVGSDGETGIGIFLENDY